MTTTRVGYWIRGRIGRVLWNIFARRKHRFSLLVDHLRMPGNQKWHCAKSIDSRLELKRTSALLLLPQTALRALPGCVTRARGPELQMQSRPRVEPGRTRLIFSLVKAPPIAIRSVQPEKLDPPKASLLSPNFIAPLDKRGDRDVKSIRPWSWLRHRRQRCGVFGRSPRAELAEVGSSPFKPWVQHMS